MKKIVVLIVLSALVLTSCSAAVSFTDAEKYGEYLMDAGYTAYIITDDYTSTPESLQTTFTTMLVLEMVLMKSDADLLPEKALLAADGDQMNVIVVFYFADEATAQLAISAMADYQVSESNKLDFNLEQSANALKIAISQT